jgi:hypothetical protein
MTDANQETIQTRFAKRCRELLDIMVEQTAKEETWDLYLAKGAGDRAIAGDHEERHLLELLQNARDAIYRGQENERRARGRVFIAATEHGMAMANTGAPFRLHDEEVLKAVRFLQRSDKAGRGFIGHKGVGLKSILLRAGAFAVRSRVNGEILRATFSRSRTAERLIAHLNESAGMLLDGQARYIRQQLPRLPLFTQPHVDAANDQSLGADTWLVETLLEPARKYPMGLDSKGMLTALPAYTTVVYLPYRDERWETLLEDTKAALSMNDRAAFERARRQSGLAFKRTNGEDLWQELENLDRRVLVLLGEIAELQFARFAGGVLQEIRRIDIRDPLSPLNGAQTAELRRIAIREQGWSRKSGPADAWERSFFVLSAATNLGVLEEETSPEEEPREHIRILLEVPKVDRPRLQDEPLFLYYPIETEHSGLPFIIHGPFRVNSSRTALVKNQQAHNRKVLQAALQLLENQIPRLVAESSEIRAWLPWILLPLADPETDRRFSGSDLQQDLDKQMIGLLRANTTVPTTGGPLRPEEVHFFPERPEALLVFDGMVKASANQERALRLLAAENHNAYMKLYAANGHVLSQAAHRIWLGRVDLRRFAKALVVHFSGSSGNMPVDEAEAKAFFLNLCVLFGDACNEEAQAAAEIIGEHRIPILPAFRENALSESKQLLLVPTERRDLTSSEKLQKASRVVFWRPLSGESRVEGMPAPPATIPVYFMAPAVIKAEGARAEGILSKFYNEWGTTRFESRPDLFRRVADRARELSGETVVPVLGYLSRLLYRITSKSFTGAEDLQPRPYAAIDLTTLRKAVHRYGSSSRVQYWEQLESLQRWTQIQVPVRGSQRFMPAGSAVFGPAWAEVLREFIREKEPTKPKDDEIFWLEREWTEVIDKLAVFREQIGRYGDDLRYPEIAPPDDERWQDARQHLRREDSLDSQIKETKALFDLLLLLGVRVGPRVAWRWLNTRERAHPDELHRSLNCETSRALFAGKALELSEDLKSLSQSPLTRAYCDFILMKPYHTFFSGGHSRGCRENLKHKGDGGSAVAAWIWFPDLMEVKPFTAPFESHAEVDAFREVIVSLWSSLSKTVLYSGWYCCTGWHKGRQWEHAIPSLAAFQLSRTNLWLSRNETHLSDVAQRRFPASVMVAWEHEEAPSGRNREQFFPLFDTSSNIRSTVAQDLDIKPLNKVTLRGALLRLRWLLQESGSEAPEAVDVPSGCWPIQPPKNTNPNDWMGIQYYLLEKIVNADPKRLWDRRAVVAYGLPLRASQVGGRMEIAVPVIQGENKNAHFAIPLAFFQNPPRRWDKQEYKGRWIIQERSQLSRALHEWAESLGAEKLETVNPPAFTGEPFHDPQAIRSLQEAVENRLDLILGVLKANRVENLEQKAQQLLEALGNLQAVRSQDARNDGLSGLDTEDRLVFSYDAYKKEQQAHRSGAVVLAEGLALLLKQPTAVGDLQHALTAPPEQVRLALDFRGVDVDAMLSEVAALADKHLNHLLKRLEQLIQALSAVQDKPVPPLHWKTGSRVTGKRMEVIQDLKRGEGELAEQALMALSEVTPHLTRSSHMALLQAVLEEQHPKVQTARGLLRILREAGWSTADRRAFIETEVGEIPPRLLHQEDRIDEIISTAIVIALIDQTQTGELDGIEDLMHALSARAHDLYRELSVQAVDSGPDFVQHLKEVLKISVPFDPTDLLLLEWEDSTWRQLIHVLQGTGENALLGIHDEIRDVLRQCLRQGSLVPLQESRERTLSERQRRIQNLERRLEEKSLHFDLKTSLTGGAFSGAGTLSAETSSPGESGGVSVGVTEDQAVRGRVAELFVLHACWQRFLAQDTPTRGQILDAISLRRKQGSGEGDDHVRWSTKAAWQTLKQHLTSRQDALLSASAEDSQLARLFRDLIEVANERGPGYDVLDPFGLWGAIPAAEITTPRRVEVKAVLHDTETPSAYRIVLSTNEYHRASRDPDSYVLRLIAVPRDPENHLTQVHWVCDIPNPVQRMDLKNRISRGVRGGILPLSLQLDN